MASKTPKNYLSPLYNSTTFSHMNNHFEFDEQDMWNNSTSSTSSSIVGPKSPNPTSRATRKSRPSVSRASAASSLPVNIPDWSKIMGRINNDDNDNDDDENEDGLEEWVPPHEFVARKLARTRIVPFSVHEGVGRTLKGRDLSRVRNAVWKQTGFED